MERLKNQNFYVEKQIVTDVTTGEILSNLETTKAKTSPEPDFIKVYYETMLAFNQIHDIPTPFVLSLSKFLSWTNDGKPQTVVLNRKNKDEIIKDCECSLPAVDRFIKRAVNSGLLFRTEYRGVYEVNPFMIAKGKWDSIRQLQTNYDFVGGKWERVVEEKIQSEQMPDTPKETKKNDNVPGQMKITDIDMNTAVGE